MDNNALKTLSVKITADISEFQKGIKEMQNSLKSMSTKGSLGNVSADFKKASNVVKSGSKDIVKGANAATSGLNSLAGAFKKVGRFSRFLVFSYLGRQLVKLVSTMSKLGMEVIETQNLFEVSFGKMADKATEFAYKLQEVWGVNATLTKKQTGYLNNMFKSMGMTEDQSYGLSTELVKLSHNMASLYDIDQTIVFDKLRNAMVGVSRPLLQLGINTKVAALEEVALRKGIISTSREMTQQEKVLATMWAIAEQTESAWHSGEVTINGQTVAIGDMTKTMMTNANMNRVLKNMLQDLGRTWGLAFQPINSFVLPLIIKLTDALRRLGQTVALFMGNLFRDTSRFPQKFKTIEELIASYGDANTAIADNTLGDYFDGIDSGAKKAKKALKTLTGSFDELNILSEPEPSGLGGGFNMNGIENDIGLPETDSLVGIFMDQINEKIDSMKQKILGLLEPFRSTFETIGEYLDTIWSKFVEISNNIYQKFIKPIVESFKEFIVEIWEGGLSELVTNIITAIGDIIIAVEDIINFLAAYVLPRVTEFILKLKENITPIVQFVIAIANSVIQVIGGIAKFISGVFTLDLDKALQGVADVFKGLFSWIPKTIVIVFNFAMEKIEQFLNWVIKQINKVEGLASKIGLGWGQIGDVTLNRLTVEDIVPALASGGIAYGKTMAMVGEYANANANPEVIAPLDKLTSIINANQQYSDEEQTDLLRQTVDLLGELLNKDVSLNIDGREIAKAVEKGNRKRGYAIMG